MANVLVPEGFVAVRNMRTLQLLGDHIQVADSFWLRFRGLMGTASLDPGEGMLFPRTNSIHMFFMRYPLTIVYLSKDMKVLRSVVVKPWSIGPILLKAQWVLELPDISQADIQTGDTVSIE
jgi:uncharacterized membrane protein (UPF0127 family)